MESSSRRTGAAWSSETTCVRLAVAFGVTALDVAADLEDDITVVGRHEKGDDAGLGVQVEAIANVLQLLVGGIADAHGARIAKAAKMPELVFGQPGVAVEVIHDMQFRPGQPGRMQEPTQITARIVDEARADQGEVWKQLIDAGLA